MPMSLLRALALALALLPGPPAAAGCAGQDLLATMPPERAEALRLAARAAPHPEGLVWRARRGAAEAVLVGTYHYDDPRHDRLAASIVPRLEGAAALLVEAGPEEEARLQREMTTNPGASFVLSGPTLPERLAPDDWARVAAAMRARGIPAPLAAKFRPWYVAVTLSISPCAMREISDGAEGLDKRLIGAAAARGLPVRALEPWDTVLHLFDGLSAAQEEEMILGALASEGRGDDLTRTLAEAYFAGQTQLIWTFSEAIAREEAQRGLQTPAQVEAQLALAQERMIDRRNAAWIPVIEQAAAAGPVMVAAGALHLPGAGGLLDRLEARGWRLERLDCPPGGAPGEICAK